MDSTPTRSVNARTYPTTSYEYGFCWFKTIDLRGKEIITDTHLFDGSESVQVFIYCLYPDYRWNCNN
jgi:hypothetical protein